MISGYGGSGRGRESEVIMRSRLTEIVVDAHDPGAQAAFWSAEVERLIGLGARRADLGQPARPWAVLTDPEGNEFCVLGPL